MRDGLEADLSNFSLGQPESRGKAHAHRMNLLVPLLFHSKYNKTNKNKQKNDTQLQSVTFMKEKQGQGDREDQNATSAAVMHIPFTLAEHLRCSDVSGEKAGNYAQFLTKTVSCARLGSQRRGGRLEKKVNLIKRETMDTKAHLGKK